MPLKIRREDSNQTAGSNRQADTLTIIKRNADDNVTLSRANITFSPLYFMFIG